MPLTESRIAAAVKAGAFVAALVAQFILLREQANRTREDLNEFREEMRKGLVEIRAEARDHRASIARHAVEIAVLQERRK